MIDYFNDLCERFGSGVEMFRDDGEVQAEKWWADHAGQMRASNERLRQAFCQRFGLSVEEYEKFLGLWRKRMVDRLERSG